MTSPRTTSKPYQPSPHSNAAADGASPRVNFKSCLPYLTSLAALWSAFLFPEILVRLASGNAEFFSIGLIRITLASLAAATTIWALGVVVPRKKTIRIVAAAVLALFAVCAIAISPIQTWAMTISASETGLSCRARVNGRRPTLR